jgi:hypothetical protein
VATLKNYARTLWDIQQTVCNKIGMDLRQASFDTRCLVVCVDASIALLIKALVDKGVFTDIELNGAVQAVRNMSFAPLSPVPPIVLSSGDGTLPIPDPLQE